MTKKKMVQEVAAAVQTPPPVATRQYAGIREAKLAAMASIDRLPRETLQGEYTFTGEDALTDAVRQAMIEHGLTVCPFRANVYHYGHLDDASERRHAVVAIAYRLTHVATGESEEGETLGEASDTGDKACAMAQTSAYKQFLRQTFCVRTGADPDARPSPPPVFRAAEAVAAPHIEKAPPAKNPPPIAAKKEPPAEAAPAPKKAPPRRNPATDEPGVILPPPAAPQANGQAAKPAANAGDFGKCKDFIDNAQTVESVEWCRSTWRTGKRVFSPDDQRKLEVLADERIEALTALPSE
jgi:hypothetical protein